MNLHFKRKKDHSKNRIATCIIFVSCLILFGCRTEIQEPRDVKAEIIDFNVNKPFNEITENEKTLYSKAQNIMDSRIELLNGQYHIKEKFSSDMGISQEIFNHFKMIMNSTNESIKGLEIVQLSNGFIIAQPNSIRSIVRLKSSGEASSGGLTQVIGKWYGYDVYLSNVAIQNIGHGGALVALVASLLPDPTATKVLAAAGSGCALAAGFLATNYPNGIIVGVTQPVAGMCVPFSLSSQ
jgi:hypothetical protein